ncbi:MAG: hypothetical protein OEZ39_16490 [Gammaproteobacteria bacterium]|nr:hypothetical protein [Gammaproteobacteria bacterium]MDH5653459.1 hypothetical protein [Gammaproteobacteria bacterium]
MKRILVYLSLSLLLYISASPKIVFAETIFGKVAFVGTTSEYMEKAGVYHATFRFKVSQSICGNDKTPKDRWIVVRSGRMDGVFIHNMANFRNAYNTVITLLLSGKNLQLDNVPSCDASKTQTVNLWGAWIGIF